MKILESLDAMEKALVAKRFPPMSPWWREQIERFYRSGRKQLVIRAGRRAGKSSTLARIAVLEALFGDHKIPPGDIGIVAFVSVKVDEASRRLRTIEAILKALGVTYKPLEDGTGIELVGRPIGFQVFAASIAGVSGATVICAVCDECAKWKDASTGANPASEVIASLKPAMMTQPNARIFLSSSPWGIGDAHAKAFAEGDNDYQQTAWAPTWIANNTITEAETRAAERDERVWLREYKAIPQASLSAAFEPEDVDAMFTRSRTDLLGHPYAPAIIIDPSDLIGRDRFTTCAVRWVYPDIDQIPDPSLWYRDERGNAHRTIAGGYVVDPEQAWRVRPVLTFWAFQEITPGMSANDVAEYIANGAKEIGARFVIGDQRNAPLWAAQFERFDVPFRSINWTAPLKQDAVLTLRRLMRDRMIAAVRDMSSPEYLEILRGELHGYAERVSAAGNMQYAARGSGRDDFAALLLTAAMGDMEGLISGTPVSLASLGYRRDSGNPYNEAA